MLYPCSDCFTQILPTLPEGKHMGASWHKSHAHTHAVRTFSTETSAWVLVYWHQNTHMDVFCYIFFCVVWWKKYLYLSCVEPIQLELLHREWIYPGFYTLWHWVHYSCLLIQKHMALPSGHSSEDMELFVCVRLSVLCVCFSSELHRLLP